MRLVRIWLVLVTVSLSALAQTNAPEVRKLSLEDCIQSALQKNLDLQIARYNVPLATLNLQGSYAGWDPSFNMGATHSFNSQPGQFNSSINTVTLGNATYNDSFNASLNGLTPWGLNYDLLGNVNQSAGILGATAGPFESSGGNAAIQLRQPLLKNFWIDATRLNIRVAKNRVHYSEQGLRLQLMQSCTAVENAYYDLIYYRENLSVQQKAYELAERLVVENKKRVEVGAMAPLDEQQAESQAASTKAAVIGAVFTLAGAERQLKQLIADDYARWFYIKLEPSATLAAPRQFFNIQDSWSKGLKQRPDLLQARLDVERQGVIIKYNQNQLFPELDVIGSYGHNAGGLFQYSQSFGQLEQGTYPTYAVGGQLTFPILSIGARAAYKSSKVTLEQLLLTLKKLEQTIMSQIDNDLGAAQSSFEQVSATRTATEYAAAALDAEQKKLESGKSTTYTVLQMQRDLTTARGNEIQALDNYNKALAQLSLDEATTLQRLGINVEMR